MTHLLRTTAARLPMADGCVQTCITSPPYWGLRAYQSPAQVWSGDEEPCAEGRHHWGNTRTRRNRGDYDLRSSPKQRTNAGSLFAGSGEHCRRCGAWRGEMGLEPTPELYIAHLVAVFREVKRVLRDDGTCWINLGDSYVSSPPGNYDTSTSTLNGAQSQAYSRRLLHKDNRNPRPRPPGLKPKNLCGIPWRVALALQADGAMSPETMRVVGRLIDAIDASYESRDEWPDRITQEVERLEREWEDAHRGGWYLRSAAPWVKRSSMPESVTDRPSSSLEYVFLLAKQPTYYFDMEAVKRPHRPSTIERGKHGWNGKVVIDADGQERRAQPDPTGEMGERWAPASGRNWRNGDFWFDSMGMVLQGEEIVGFDVNPQPYREAHFATWPEKLVEPMIRAGTSERGCCPVCRAPWVRVVDVAHVVHRANGNRPAADERGAGASSALRGNGRDYKAVTTTTGWRPGCACGREDVLPCIVLDPFSGSGTTLRVAARLRRRAVGCDLQPAYFDLARDRAQVQVEMEL